jgi:hypothetical protein
MKYNLSRCAAQLALLGACAAFAPAAFADSTWTFNSSNCAQGATNSGNYGNSYSCNSGSSSVALTAWSTTSSGSTFANANLALYDGGFGVRNRTETLSVGQPNHSMDNSGQTDLIALNFGSATADLSALKIGWSQNDTDVSLLYYSGTGTPDFTTQLQGLTTAQLLAKGWSLVSNYSLSTSSATAVNPANYSSSWWLVSAFNSGYGKTGDGYSDYVKLLSVAALLTTPPPPSGKLPEPSSLALLGLAFCAAVGVSRRKNNRAALAAA